MGRFSSWAGRKTPLIDRSAAPQQSPPLALPISHSQPLIHYAPGFRGAVTLYPGQPYLGTVPDTNMLVKQDTGVGSSYENFLRGVPEGAPLAEVDATMMPGLPDGGVGEQWKPTTRYRNGSTDQSALPKFLDYVRGKYRTTASQFRSAIGMSVRNGS